MKIQVPARCRAQTLRIRSLCSRTVGSASRSRRPAICVVGSGTEFLSGVSYYTYYLAGALSTRVPVSAILMRKLIPRQFYPGRNRVGATITHLRCADLVPTFDGVDWFGIPSILQALLFLLKQRPTHLLFQWWSGSVLPWYIILAVVGRLTGIRTIVEFHESLDTGEARIPLVKEGVWVGLRFLILLSDSFIVHSESDRKEFVNSLNLPLEETYVIPHGPFPIQATEAPSNVLDGDPNEADEDHPITILFFGTIRPYKGLEFLVQAFEKLAMENSDRWKLLVVGEPWEGWTKPIELIERSRCRKSIEFVPRYVSDEELGSFFRRADLVVLPYLRSSASGPLHMTMAFGLPVVVTNVGGLGDVAARYSGSVLIEPESVDGILEGIRRGVDMVGPFVDPYSWDSSAEIILGIIDKRLRRDTKQDCHLGSGAVSISPEGFAE